MHKALVMEVDACTGCHQCELMCSYGKVGAFNTAKSVMDIDLRRWRNKRSFHLYSMSGSVVHGGLPSAGDYRQSGNWREGSFSGGLCGVKGVHDRLPVWRHQL